MEGLKLTDQEQRVYADLFGLCDVESTGKVTGLKASELFLSSGLPQETLHQITELCGAKRLGHFGRSQFYIALKLIAAAQIGLPPMPETFSAGRDVPLPMFNMQFDGDARRLQYMHGGFNHQSIEQDYAVYDRTNQMLAQQMAQQQLQQQQMQQQQLQQQQQQLQQHHLQQQQQQQQMQQQQQQQQTQLPPPPKQIRRPLPGFDPQGLPQGNSQPPAVGPEPRSPPFSPKQSPPTSPNHRPSVDHVVNNVSVAPLPATPQGGAKQPEPFEANHHKTPEKGWASFETPEDSQEAGLISQENKEWAHFTDSTSKGDTSSVSSEAESVDDVWSITDEQREYYTNQFKTMQADVKGVISGAVAKDFFEKSKLPFPELSKIWQLSDVNKDGALSLEEFCTAMHLVVLRRNDIALPDHLPPSLMPYIPLLNPEEPFAADLPPGSTLKRMSPASPSQQQWQTMFTVAESPTSSSVSSPGSKPTPVNFEFRPITADTDSRIVHPVALRMSPDGQAIAVEGTDNNHVGQSEYNDDLQSPTDTLTSPTKKDASMIDSLIDLGPETQGPAQLVTPLQSRPRPTPKKQQSVPGPSQDQPILLPPPSSQDPSQADRPTSLPVGSGVAESVPRPPPRAKADPQSRSSSVDDEQHLIDLSDSVENQMKPPPAVPPRPKDGSGLAGAGESTEAGAMAVLVPEGKTSVSPIDDEEAFGGKQLATQSSLDTRDVHAAIRKQKIRNITLSRLNNELNMELQEVMEQRIALEIQLEHLRPFSS